MPNTLAHIGIQGVLTRSINRNIDLKWICLAAVIPDLPWVLRRIARFIQPEWAPYDLKLYVSVQASLLFCLLLAGFFALLAKQPRQVFWSLALGALLHLLLDAAQIKWANGVHLLAPFDWQQINYGWFWPDSPVTYGLSLFGLLYLLYYWRQGSASGSGLLLHHWPRTGLAALLLAVYFLVPGLFLEQAASTDSHFIQTLRNTAQRAGKYIELDRVYFSPAPVRHVQMETGESIKVQGIPLQQAAIVSLQGRFSSNRQILVSAYHVHPTGVRDGLSVIGLGLVLVLWMGAIGAELRGRRQRRTEQTCSPNDLGRKN